MPAAHPEFIRLSDREGRPVFLNMGEIASIASLAVGAAVKTRDGSMFEVREGAEQIVEQVLGPEAETITELRGLLEEARVYLLQSRQPGAPEGLAERIGAALART